MDDDAPITPAPSVADGPTVDARWLASTLAASSDLVLAIAADTTITWVNDTALPLLGHRPADVVGRSFAEFVHPDDLGRAAEVLELALAGAFDLTPITPALYRVARADGGWVSLEVNAALSPVGDGSLLLVARAGGDLVLADRLLEAVTAREPFDEQVDLVLAMGRWRHPADGYAILYRDLDGRPRASASDLPPALAGQADSDGATPWAAVAESGGEVVVDAVASVAPDDPVLGPDLARIALDAGYVGCVAASVPDPLHPDGACIVIWTTFLGPSSSGHRYGLDNMRRALTLVLQQRAQLALLEKAARVDDLTGVTSRARFFEVLARVEASSPPQARHALLFVDLDGFKAVNDTHGHRAGDGVLHDAAQRIAGCAPAGATVARLGGDEFAVLCPSGTTEDEAAALADAIVGVIAVPFEVDADTGAEIGVSVGVAVGEPGQPPHAVLDAADSALFDAKAEGRGRWRAHTRGA